MPDNVWSLLGMLATAAAILLAAHYTTKWIAARGLSRYAAGCGAGDFRVLRQTGLGKDAQAVLLQLGERCLLLGVTPGGVTLLRELDREEAAQWTKEEETATFLEALQKDWPKKK